MEINPKEIGKRIRELRLSKGFTQEQLAEKSKRHFTYIGRVERGEKNISVQSLSDILSALDTSFQSFFIPFETFDHDPIEEKVHTNVTVPLLELNEKSRESIFQIVKIAIELNKEGV